MSSLDLTFRIFLKDDFMEQVREYAEVDSVEDVTFENIHCFVEDHIKPAQSKCDCFKVEGGDTDGWFIDGVNDGY